MGTEWIMVRMPRSLHERIQQIAQARSEEDSRTQQITLTSEDGPEPLWKIMEILVARHERAAFRKKMSARRLRARKASERREAAGHDRAG